MWKTQQWSQDCKRSVFIPIPKKSSAKECSNYRTIVLISHTNKVKLILPTFAGSLKKQRWFQKNIYFCFIDYAKVFDCVDHNKLWKILKEMGITDHLTCLLRNLYAGQETTVRIEHGITDWFHIRKGVHQGCILSSCLF